MTNPYIHSMLIIICFRRKKQNTEVSECYWLMDSKIPKMFFLSLSVCMLPSFLSDLKQTDGKNENVSQTQSNWEPYAKFCLLPKLISTISMNISSQKLNEAEYWIVFSPLCLSYMKCTGANTEWFNHLRLMKNAPASSSSSLIPPLQK